MKPWHVWGCLLVGLGGWLGPWVALAGLINEGMEEGEPWDVLGLTLVGYRGWLGAVGRFGRTY